jgi:hypothetical protein
MDARGSSRAEIKESLTTKSTKDTKFKILHIEAMFTTETQSTQSFYCHTLPSASSAPPR